MFEWLRDPFWQGVAGIIAGITLIGTIIITLLTRKKKKLSYVIKYRTSIINGNKNLSEKVKILYENKNVKTINLLILEIINSGNVPITSSDYERDVELRIIECNKILSADIVEKNPQDIVTNIKIEKQNIRLAPTLLNPGDTINIKLLVDGSVDKLEIVGRIIGVKKIIEMKEKHEIRNRLIFVINVAILLFGLGFGIYSYFFYEEKSTIFMAGVICGSYFITGITFIFIRVIKKMRLKKQMIGKNKEINV